MKASEVIPPVNLKILDLGERKNLLNGRMRNGRMRTDLKENLEGFKKYYLEEIDSLREVKKALPKE